MIDFFHEKNHDINLEKHERMAIFGSKNRFFGNKTAIHTIKTPEIVINQLNSQKYAI